MTCLPSIQSRMMSALVSYQTTPMWWLIWSFSDWRSSSREWRPETTLPLHHFPEGREFTKLSIYSLEHPLSTSKMWTGHSIGRHSPLGSISDCITINSKLQWDLSCSRVAWSTKSFYELYKIIKLLCTLGFRRHSGSEDLKRTHPAVQRKFTDAE